MHGMKSAILLFLVASAFAQQQSALPLGHEASRPAHTFFDRTARFSLAGSAMLFAADAANTCAHIGPYVREVSLPVKSCGGIAIWTAGNFGSQIGIAYLFHRFHHHRLERTTEIFGASGSALGMALSRSK